MKNNFCSFSSIFISILVVFNLNRKEETQQMHVKIFKKWVMRLKDQDLWPGCRNKLT